jgi:hypothetical protein
MESIFIFCFDDSNDHCYKDDEFLLSTWSFDKCLDNVRAQTHLTGTEFYRFFAETYGTFLRKGRYEFDKEQMDNPTNEVIVHFRKHMMQLCAKYIHFLVRQLKSKSAMFANHAQSVFMAQKLSDFDLLILTTLKQYHEAQIAGDNEAKIQAAAILSSNDHSAMLDGLFLIINQDEPSFPAILKNTVQMVFIYHKCFDDHIKALHHTDSITTG